MHDGYQDSLVAVFLRGDMSCESMTAFKAETSFLTSSLTVPPAALLQRATGIKDALLRPLRGLRCRIFD